MNTMTESPVKFSAGAITELKRLMADPEFDFSNTLRIGVKGGGCSGLSYVLGFDKQSETDNQYVFEGIQFVIDKVHELYLAGMEIDWENGLNNRGFMFKNPNASATCGCGSSFAV